MEIFQAKSRLTIAANDWVWWLWKKISGRVCYMGADFMYALAPVWKATDERKAKLKEVIGAISDESLKEYDDSYCFFNTEDMEEARGILYSACLEVADQYDSTNRETSWLKLEGMSWRAVITGGMSWGDHPTESFESIAMVGTVEEVFELLKQWSMEDEK